MDPFEIIPKDVVVHGILSNLDRADLVRCVYVSKKWRDISVIVLKYLEWKITKLVMSDKLNVNDIDFITNNFGKFIEIVSYSNAIGNIGILLAAMEDKSYMNNYETRQKQYTSNLRYILEKIMERCPNLKKCDFRGIGKNMSIDDIIALFSKCHHLEKMSLQRELNMFERGKLMSSCDSFTRSTNDGNTIITMLR